MEPGFPLVMVLWPVIAATLALVVRRWRRVALAIGLASALLLTVLLWLAAPGGGLFGDTAALFGRPLTLTPTTRGAFLFIYPALAVLFGLAWFRPWGRALAPAALAALGAAAAALMIAPLGPGAILLAAAIGLTAPAVYSGDRDAAGAAWRVFLLAVLGLAPLLAVAWLLSSGQSGGSGGALLAAMLILLGGAPFHIWVRPLARHAPLGALVLLLGLLPAAIVVYLFGLLDAAPAFRASADFQSALRLSAALTTLMGAFMMTRAADRREWLAAALLLDGGFLLTTALAPGAAGLVVALTALIGRVLALLLVGLGLLWPASPAGATNGQPRRLPDLRTALLAYGALSLVGVPLTPGFPGRWAELALLPSATGIAGWLLWLTPVLLLAALAAGAWSVGRFLAIESPTSSPAPGRGERVAAALLLALAGLLGLLPGLLAVYATRLVGS